MQKGNLLFTTILLICILGSLIFIISFIAQISLLGIAGLLVFSVSFILLVLLPQKLSKEEILDESFFSIIVSLSKIIDNLNAKGDSLIIPTVTHSDEFLLFVPYTQEREPGILLEINKLSKQAIMRRGILLKPIGFSLVKLFEKRIHINFSMTNLSDLSELLHRILVEECKLITDIYIEILSNRIFVQLVDSLFLNISWKLHIESPKILTQLGCPLSSAIGCIISKITGRTVHIASYNIDNNKKLTEIVYNLYGSF